MRRPPALARALMRALLPRHAIAESLEGDLAEGFAHRAAESPVAARWWYRRKVLTLPYLALRREIGRLREREGAGRVQKGGGWMGGMSMDLRVAVRALLRRPSFTGVAVATLALSIGAATLLFSVVEAVLLTPLPYQNPDELVTVYLTSDEWRDSDNELMRMSYDVYLPRLDFIRAFREAPGPVTDVTGYTYRRLPLDPGDGSEDEAETVWVDDRTLDVLGVAPIMGRLPSEDEFRESVPVAVLRHATWMTRFGGDPDVLGRSFRFGDDTYTVIGVMPPGFFFPQDDGGDLWAPLPEEAGDWPVYGLARMAPGSTTEATDFFETVARRLGEEEADNAGFGGRAVPHLDSVVGNVRGGIRLLFGTALLVVLVACVNLGNLFLARVASRREELAVRASLGAGTGSLAASVLSEVLVVGLVGGGLGVLLAVVSIDPFVEALGTALRDLPRQGAIGLDASVLLFSLVATLATTLAAGLGPTLGSARRAPASALGGTRGSARGDGARRGQRLLLAVQGALTVVLVSGAALLARSFLEATRVEMGMATERVAVLDVEFDRDRFEDIAEIIELRNTVQARMAALPGVTAAGLTSTLPSTGGILILDARPEGTDPDQTASVPAVSASPGYFESLGIPVVHGRGFEESDATGAELGTIVSESLAVQLFRRTDVVGQRLLTGTGEEPSTSEIVGVVGEARQLSTFQEPAPTLYTPVLQRRPGASFYVTMSVDGDPTSVLDQARAAVLAIEPGIEVLEATTLQEMLRRGMRHIRLRMILMASLAGLAGVLAMIGISGVVAHFLSEQTRDVGIRMALGAKGRREVGRVVRHALTPTALGLAIGVVIARSSSRVMESFVFGVELRDPHTYAAVTASLLVVAALAAWLPARRTASVDPATVLNGE